jgi:hypothetical protein
VAADRGVRDDIGCQERASEMKKDPLPEVPPGVLYCFYPVAWFWFLLPQAVPCLPGFVISR